MTGEIFERIVHLEQEHVPFAIATVVGRSAPVSSHLGDRALVFADGRMEGFVGGSCSRDIVRRQAIEAMRRRESLLVQIRPGVVLDEGEDGRIVVPMRCSSEGAIDVYIEPRLPRRTLLVVGFTPVADAIAGVGAALGDDVIRVVADDELRDLGAPAGHVVPLGELPAYLTGLPDAVRGGLAVVVASQGHYDEAALEALLDAAPAYLGLLASRRRAASVTAYLAERGCAPERIATIRNPVGLDIGARRPGDVAVSVLAEIIAATPTPPSATDVKTLCETHSVVDPVCGMEVEVTGHEIGVEHDGISYAFCCAGCRTAFIADPPRYLTPSGGP
jgi:xanthine dehydrogenase accessory factor